jgi:hypothetical protein
MKKMIVLRAKLNLEPGEIADRKIPARQMVLTCERFKIRDYLL